MTDAGLDRSLILLPASVDPGSPHRYVRNPQRFDVVQVGAQLAEAANVPIGYRSFVRLSPSGGAMMSPPVR